MTGMPLVRHARDDHAPRRRSAEETHKFKVGQTLRFVPAMYETGARPGTFTVVRLLPPEGGENQYRIKSSTDGHERVVREGQLG